MKVNPSLPTMVSQSPAICHFFRHSHKMAEAHSANTITIGVSPSRVTQINALTADGLRTAKSRALACASAFATICEVKKSRKASAMSARTYKKAMPKIVKGNPENLVLSARRFKKDLIRGLRCIIEIMILEFPFVFFGIVLKNGHGEVYFIGRFYR